MLWDSPFSLTSLGFYTWFSLKMIVGVLILFGKRVMHTVLPPLFRTLATVCRIDDFIRL